MIYVLAALVVGFYSQLVVKFWLTVRKFGKWNETIGREHHMFAMDSVSLFTALMVVYWAAHDWFGFSLPLFPKAPMASWECTLLAISCAVASLTIGYFNGRERFTKATHAGIAESALRFLATRQIITAAEVAQAMSNSQVIDITAHEVRK